jgi:hypothetical protein
MKTAFVPGVLTVAGITAAVAYSQSAASPVSGASTGERAAPQAAGARALGDPVLEAPTLRSLGVYWIVDGDENRNARIEVAYRKAGTAAWKKGPALFRVERDAHRAEGAATAGKMVVPDDASLFAGSLLLLAPNTAYEIRLRLADPDGGTLQKLLTGRTIAEPLAPPNPPRFHVVPGNGGGTGAPRDPFRGLAAAQAAAKPGDTFLLHAGVYPGTFEIGKSGEPGKPIVWRGAGNGEAILDGQGTAATRPGRVVSASQVHDVWFENLTLRNGDYGLVGHESARVVVRRCRIYGVESGIVCGRNPNDTVRGWFISDNVLEGPSVWPRTKGIEDARGIQITGQGSVVCYNRIERFADAIDTLPSVRCEAIDFHNNDINEMTDDGIEMDYSQRNTRCFLNRLTNVYQGISLQPIYGGPVYIFRNALYNVGVETFKMHNSPSGALMLHNTSVKKGMPLILWTNVPVRNSVSRNNLFIGSAPSGMAYETTAPMQADCDFDYDGFGGGPWEVFLKWNNARYATLEEVKARAPVYKHAVIVDAATLFTSGLRAPDDQAKRYSRTVNDLRLRPGTKAQDAGQVLPGINDGFAGKAPDLGAYERGSPLPHYGPRPVGK